MKASDILKKLCIKSEDLILEITVEEALRYIFEVVDEYCPNLKINKMSKKDMKTLLNSYGECMITYHPENQHQEIGALLQNYEMLKKYGFTKDNYDTLDFC